jgi:transposase
VALARQHDQPGAPTRGGRERGGAAHAIGRSRGGPSTKVHLVVDALGLPLTFEITEGQRNDIVPAKELASRVLSRCLLADKAYDARDFRASLEASGCTPVIPWNRSRSTARTYDKELYKARSEIEWTFNLLKQARRFATRYEKTLRNYAAVVALGCAMLWLRI